MIGFSFPALAHDSQPGETPLQHCASEASPKAQFACYNELFPALKSALQQAEENAVRTAITLDKVQKSEGGKNNRDLALESRKAYDAYVETECGRRKNIHIGSEQGSIAALACRLSLMQNRLELLQP